MINKKYDQKLLSEIRKPPFTAAFTGESKWVTYKLILLFSLMNLGFYSFSTIFINFLKADIHLGGIALDKIGQLPFQLLLNLASLLSVILAGAISDYWGRKKSSLIFCMIGLIGFLYLNRVIQVGGDIQQIPTQLMLPFALCCTGFGINGVMGIFAPELFPTHLRSTSPGVSQNIGKGIGGMLGPWLAGTLVISHGYAFVLSLPGWLFILVSLLVLTLPEVGGRSLEERY